MVSIYGLSFSIISYIAYTAYTAYKTTDFPFYLYYFLFYHNPAEIKSTSPQEL